MKRVIILLGVACCCLRPCCGQPAAPVVNEDDSGVTVQTAAFRASFKREFGGVLQTLDLASGERLVTFSMVYTDRLFGRPKKYYGTKCEHSPNMKVTRSRDAVTVETEGRLLDEEGKPPDIGQIEYSVRYTFDDSARARVRITIRPGFDEPALSGFLAYMISLAPQKEFFANTEDGRICEEAATVSKRTWQSVREPLSRRSPWLGVLLRTGTVLKFTITGFNTPLQNTFFHDSGKGPTTLFLAWLDGGVRRPAHKGDEWNLEFSIEAVPLARFEE